MPEIVLNVPTFNNPFTRKVAAGVDVLLADGFNRPDAAVLGATPTGNQTWQVFGTGSAGIENNTAYVSAPGINSGSRTYAMVDPGVADGILEVTLVDLGPSGQDNSPGNALVVAGIDQSNLIFLAPKNSVDGYSLMKRVSGTGSSIGSAYKTSQMPQPGDVIRVERRANLLTVFVNDSQMFNPFDMTGVLTGTANRVGFGGYPSAGPSGGGIISHWDSFSFGVPRDW